MKRKLLTFIAVTGMFMAATFTAVAAEKEIESAELTGKVEAGVKADSNELEFEESEGQKQTGVSSLSDVKPTADGSFEDAIKLTDGKEQYYRGIYVMWHSFEVKGNNSFLKYSLANYNLEAGIRGSVYIGLYDSKGNFIDNTAFAVEEGDDYWYSRSEKVTKGKYYLAVLGDTYLCAYGIKAEEIKDDAGDNGETATTISLNKEYTKQINVPGDVDIYKFKPSTTGSYTFKFQNVNMNAETFACIGTYNKKNNSIDYFSGDMAYASKGTTKTITTTTLTKGKQYYIYVANEYSNATGKYKLAVINKKSIIGKPGSVKAASAGYKSVKVSWKKVSGASGYEIYRAASKNGSYKKAGTVASGKSSYTDSGLTTGKKYFYKVKAVKSVWSVKGTSIDSSVASAVPALSKAANVKAVKSGSKAVKVSWKKVSGANKYEVYRATSKNGKYQKAATVKGTSFTNKNLKKGSTYYYKIKAVRSSGKNSYKSGYSAVVNCKR